MDLKGKSAIITGSSSGIGLGIATALAKAGVNIMLNGYCETESRVNVVVDSIRGLGVSAEYHGGDVGKAEQILDMVEATTRAFGGVDIMVSNAGIQFVSPIEDFPLEKWDSVIATNLSSVFYASRCVVPAMKKKGWGRIINIASVHGLVGSANKAAYVAAKHGVVGLTKVVGLELAGSGVTCNAICPGWVLTPLVQKQIDDIAARDGLDNEQASRKLLAEKQPSGQFATPEEIGCLAVFLCSDAARQMTGSAISVDGGWQAR